MVLLGFSILYGFLYAGLAFSNTKTTACHSISYPLTMKYNIPHKIAVSMTLGEVMKLNKIIYRIFTC
ncbi:iron-containing alcohol dehydrogenase [Maledivibacter halophilus]|uniref:iron-containing alcohol dehydrogenase n=1 Tax=Maledivibacter halophilus TaxID=36842 RepID=UPI0009A6227A